MSHLGPLEGEGGLRDVIGYGSRLDPKVGSVWENKTEINRTTTSHEPREHHRMNGTAMRTGTVRPTFPSAAQSKQDVGGRARQPVLGPQGGRRWEVGFPASQCDLGLPGYARVKIRRKTIFLPFFQQKFGCTYALHCSRAPEETIIHKTDMGPAFMKLT